MVYVGSLFHDVSETAGLYNVLQKPVSSSHGLLRNTSNTVSCLFWVVVFFCNN